MTPTLIGRIQTRIVLLATVGVLWTVIVVPLLPKGGASIGAVYTATGLALVVVAGVGILWELLYHLLQQYRWEKDWPIVFSLLEGIPEGIVAFIIIRAVLDPPPSALTFFLHFATTWLVVWLVAIGPLRVVLLRWKFAGGRMI